MGQGAAVLRSKDPKGLPRRCGWALFAVYQAIHTLIGAAVDAAGIPPTRSASLDALAAAIDYGHGRLPPSPD